MAASFSRRVYIFVLLSCLPSVLLSQQNITISWPSKQLLSQPVTVNGPTAVNIVLQNINDVLYTYEVTLTATPVTPPVLKDYAADAALLPTGDPCKDPKDQLANITGAFDAWQLNPWLDTDNKTPLTTPASVALSTTLQYYQLQIQQPLAAVSTLLGPGHCDDATVNANYEKVSAQSAALQSRMNGSHTVTVAQTLAPFNNYTINLSEYTLADPLNAPHGAMLTSACVDDKKVATQCKVQYQPLTDLISMSGGFLFSELQARTYSRESVPTSSNAVLVVHGNSMSSLLAALVNVKLPCVPKTCSWQESGYSFAVSVGPVYSLNGSDVSKVGLFAGGSLSLWKYLFLSAGTHVGQFADFPAGITSAGQEIPSSFTGSLTPVSRTSARFAFGLTFRGFSIPTGSKQSPGQVTTSSGTK
jgi:hypothetical protein